MKQQILLAACCLLIWSAAAQSVGQWKSYLPFQQGISVTQGDTMVYYASPAGLLAISRQDWSTTFVTKADGLSEASLRLVRYNKPTQKLIIAYQNGNIDILWRDGTVHNLPDIMNNLTIVGDRTIYDVTFWGKKALFSCGFGLVVLDMDTELFDFTLFTGVEVNSANAMGDKIYLATADGVYHIAHNQGLNLADFGNWSLLGADVGLPDSYSSRAVIAYENQLYFSVDSALYRLNGTNAEPFFEAPGFLPIFLTADNVHLVAGFSCAGGCNGAVYRFNADGSYAEATGGCVSRPLYAIEDNAGRMFYADEYAAFRFTFQEPENCSMWQFSQTPYSQNTLDVETYQNEVYVASGGLTPSLSNLYIRDGLFYYRNGIWGAYQESNTPALAANYAGQDVLVTAVNPKNGKAYGGSYFGGLFEVATDQTVTVYNYLNSTLQDDPGDLTRTRVSGLAFDTLGNLWVANYNAPKGMSVLKADGTWKSFTSPSNKLWRGTVDPFGIKWFTTTDGKLIAFDDNGTIDVTSDDKWREYTQNNSIIPSDRVGSVAVDRDGDVWVGTDKGVVRLTCTGDLNDCFGNRPQTIKDGIPAYLMEGQDVRCIAIDGANRKWFGTTTGVFVVSPDGTREVANYTKANSPLPDNVINDIAINPTTGEVFIATMGGLMSYRGEATEGGDFHALTAHAFPNPVRPEYDGLIAIDGLAEDSNVKITDINGLLVYDGSAFGGRAVWNGRDYNGNKVAAGVYLVFSTSTNTFDNPYTLVSKIVVIR